ncbi:MAG: hypothetical protein P1U46_00520 [Patescibacteria group bacterium]|nr:hypothetical protein [Patescibacteria group bacterium]
MLDLTQRKINFLFYEIENGVYHIWIRSTSNERFGIVFNSFHKEKIRISILEILAGVHEESFKDISDEDEDEYTGKFFELVMSKIPSLYYEVELEIEKYVREFARNYFPQIKNKN